jgi:long-chain acyl-CoA synthetase
VIQKTLANLLSTSAVGHGDRIALVSDGREISYGELDRRARRFGTHLKRIGVRAGDRVTLCTANSVDWAVAYYGTLCTGAVINPLNALLTAEEVAYVTENCGATLLIADAAKCANVADLRAHGKPEQFLTIGAESLARFPSFGEALASVAEGMVPATVQPQDVAALLYTSGTTGHPKGAMITHRALLLNAALTAQMHARTADDTVVTALPLPHVYGAAILNAAVLTGMKLVVHSRFREASILEDLARHRATMFEGVPTMYHYLLACPELEECDLSSLRRCTVGGQTMPVSKMQEVERRFGCPLIELWGMTELGGLGTTHASYATPRLGSIGVPLPHMEIRLGTLRSGQPQPRCGDVGELMIRGPLVMKGYFGDESATSDALDESGWLRTGDLGRQDEEGYIYIVDRKNDMIITAGYNVYPAEIERVVATHPAVGMVAVAGVPDEIKGEVACAYVVLSPPLQATEEELLTHCREYLAAYKVPRIIRFVTDLPKTSTGKVLRRALSALSPPAVDSIPG